LRGGEWIEIFIGILDLSFVKYIISCQGHNKNLSHTCFMLPLCSKKRTKLFFT